ncbi:acetyl-CoA carboxylase, carboxyltransferase subunit beta [Clostridium swellfunianum]|uniref:acetyl-CoA carboxylase, carboxyltransferase subunit beta n=1 Tax=Clostridium swellfunianum TaxID=1367462 RepID=UPI00202F113C|nr:acetyl-CoA carboxylase, carboxyltransferase subunit beta [Clostridium swellfunianum]MCM0650326.1 acetyl-CoA carboxylase, carboxyltransferase subunit beta [Clostridium swellfunianum]
MFNGLFKKTKYITVSQTPVNTVSQNTKPENKQEEQKPNIPNGMWVKCECCGKTLYKKDLEKHQLVCQDCGKHFRMPALDRINYIIDEGTFVELDRKMTSGNPLDFPGYENKLKGLREDTGLDEAAVVGKGKINGQAVVIGVMDSRFMMGSMGSVVGEKLTRAIENATKKRLPVVIFTASGGARMQEGMYSLMQMAKVSAALARHNEEGLLYVPVLTDPTTGGVTASFAMLGDIILAEPGALIGFAGKRVIEQTIKQSLPEGFQTAEFLLEHGFIDAVVPREKQKEVLAQILNLHVI